MKKVFDADGDYVDWVRAYGCGRRLLWNQFVVPAYMR